MSLRDLTYVYFICPILAYNEPFMNKSSRFYSIFVESFIGLISSSGGMVIRLWPGRSAVLLPAVFCSPKRLDWL